MAFTVIRIILISPICVLGGMNLAHVLQERRYDILRMKNRFAFSDPQIWRHVLIAAVAGIVDGLLPTFTTAVIQNEQARTTFCAWLMVALFTIAAVADFIVSRDRDTEYTFVLTTRTFRLLCVFAVLCGLGAWLMQSLSLSPYYIYGISGYAFRLTGILMRRVEEKISGHYYRRAAKKIAACPKLITIGIVGTYGKTEVKMILKTILSQKYRVLATPPNFSAAMGIARTIHDKLTDRHRIFIAEMSATQKGEVREMTKMTSPKYAIVTCIGSAERNPFRSVEAAAQSVNELLSRLPENGATIFGSDGGYSDRMYALYKGRKFNAGPVSERNCYMQARNVETGPHGSRFELFCHDGDHIWIKTPLVGMYSVRNIAIAAAMAKQLGMTMEQIAEGAAKLKYIPGRLQVIPGEVNKIDDSRNTDPEAAIEALKVLKEFPGRRVLVTGGFEENNTNYGYDYGIQIAGCADHVVIVSQRRTRGIREALSDTQFPKGSIHIIKSAGDIENALRGIVSRGDTILLEGVQPGNDPDD